MAMRGTLIYLCSLAVVFTSAVQNETMPANCSSADQQFDRLSTELKAAVQCGEVLLSQWSSHQTAALLHSMRNFADTLHKHQLKACQGAEPDSCPAPEVHSNGGLLCLTVSGVHYCKPMCNDGYDFDFLRRSRVYETCSKDRWTTQYIGGNRLAVCNKSTIKVSGVETAYFEQDCLTTKSSSDEQSKITEMFISELIDNVGGKPSDYQNICLVCG